VGIALGLVAALMFGAASLLARVGMRTSPRDDGLFLTIVVNVVMLGGIALFVSRPPWSTKGVAALAAAGIVGVVAGRYANLRAIRYVGATRTGVFLSGAPLVTATAGWVALDESVGLVDAIGGGLILASLVVLILSRSTAAAVPGSQNRGTHDGGRSIVVGYLFAIATPILIGLTLAIRKWGLQSYDSAVLGAFIGSAAAFTLFLVFDLASGRLRARIVDNFAEVNWWFVATGAAISIAVLTQFMAFAFAPAWVVGVLQATQALWVLLLSYSFLRGEEHIDLTVVVTTFGTAAGVVLIAVAV